MRRLLTFVSAALASGTLFAGGLVTNTNQSATWARMPSRNASIKADAVYYNPAGLMMMDNGFHFSLNNQTIFQKRTIETTYAPPLNSGTYKGSVTTPFFPSIYAAFKMDKIAFSVGFLPIGGGGEAIYNDGLPSFEMSQSDLVPSLGQSDYGVTAYKMDIDFKGTSAFLGFQGAVSYKVNDWLSVAAGARYVTAKNTYEGYLRDVQVNTTEGWEDASAVIGEISATAQAGGVSLNQLITNNLGGFTADQLVQAEVINEATRNAIVGGLTSLGIPNAATLTIAQSQATFYGAARIYGNKATLLEDQEAEVEQSGSGIAPFFSINISPSENFNIAVRYEMATKVELTSKTTRDLTTGYLGEDPTKPVTRFPNGAKIRNDLPAILAVGAELRFPLFSVNAGANYYFDKSADYGHYVDMTPENSTDYLVHIDNEDIIANNGLSISAGAEINVTERLAASAGYSFANQGVNNLYQSDLTYGLSAHTVGAGGAFAFSDNVKLNLGVSYTKYMDDSVKVNHYLEGINLMPTETYKKNTLVIGVGLDLSF
ncbi:MAG: outer membrane protein transport protein [Bacteroidales bacterium]